MSEDRAGKGEGPDADENGNLGDDGEVVNDEGADPTNDMEKQSPGSTTTADKVDDDDPHKTEKLTKAGRDEVDPDAGSD